MICMCENYIYILITLHVHIASYMKLEFSVAIISICCQRLGAVPPDPRR